MKQLLALLPLALGASALSLAPRPLLEESASEEGWTQERLEAVTREIQAAVEELRGSRFTSPVKVQLCDEEELVRYAERRIAALETPDSIAADEAIAKLLGLIDPGLDLMAATFALLEGQVGGFYDPSSDTFFLMQRFGTGGAARIILAHELAHALDDQIHDLDAKLAGSARTTDGELAFQAVVEGSGMAAMNGWMATHREEWSFEDLVHTQELSGDALKDAPMALWKPMLASYWLGDAFLRRSDKFLNATLAVPANADIERAFAAPPRSTEQILHPEKYWDADSIDEPIAVEVGVGELPAGWKLLATDTLGELACAMITTPFEERLPLDVENPVSVMGLKFTNAAARGWGGDQLVLLGRDDSRILRWVTTWDSAVDAKEFHAALTRLREPVLDRFTEFPVLEGGAAEVDGDDRVGFLVEAPGDERDVVVTTWAGVERSELERVLAALSSSVRHRGE